MKSRAGFTSLLVFLAFAMIQLAACSGTPSTFNKVTLTPSGTKFIGENGTIALTASVLNDKANGGVTFTVSPAGTGTLTQTSSTSANYAHPPRSLRKLSSPSLPRPLISRNNPPRSR